MKTTRAATAPAAMLAICALALPGSAYADESSDTESATESAAVDAAAIQPAPPPEKRAHRYRIALGPGFGTPYPGADHMNFSPYIDLDRARGTDYFAHESPDESFSVPIFSRSGFSIGPSLALVGKRKQSDAPGMDVVKRSVELGGAAQLEVGEHLYGFAEVRKAVSGHDGWVAQAGVDYVMRDRDDWLISFGPRVKWGDGKQTGAYFDVTPQEAIATGLPEYDAGSGIQGVGATLGADFAIGGPWGVAGYASYVRLVGDAASSPVTRAFGSKDQFGVGVALSYSFTTD
ncbi:MipA/OmpV family protein [Croceicoccus mobilis]|uniref:MipA/OmpV family protein n=1 Tax=Croceicoccus mobilis TaxID=1703339 RepID=A0A917DUZ9_9SPHN|nr:MipA/OmpV family protein [Croceicoccus mobilis]GGD73057.1 hypothetical protein GCM10010990_23370 [Croceicoccus mobilis]